MLFVIGNSLVVLLEVMLENILWNGLPKYPVDTSFISKRVQRDLFNKFLFVDKSYIQKLLILELVVVPNH